MAVLSPYDLLEVRGVDQAPTEPLQLRLATALEEAAGRR